MADAEATNRQVEYPFRGLRYPRWLVVLWLVSALWMVIQGVLARKWVYAAVWACVFALAGAMRLVLRRRPPLTRVVPDGLEVRLGVGKLRHVAWSDMAQVKAPTRWESVTKVKLRDGRELHLPGLPPDAGARLAEEFEARHLGEHPPEGASHA